VKRLNKEKEIIYKIKESKPRTVILIGEEKWSLFSNSIYTYRQVQDKAQSWAITAGSDIKTKIVPYKEGYLLYYR